MDHIIIEFEELNTLKDIIVDIVLSPLDLLSPLLLLDRLLDPVVPEGALVCDLTRQQQRVQSKIAKFNIIARVFIEQFIQSCYIKTSLTKHIIKT